MTSPATNIGPFHRSAESRAFETFWHALRRDAPVPARGDFHPAKALRFLRDIVLMESPRNDYSALRIKVAGDRFAEITGFNLAGHDPIAFLPQEFREGAVRTGRLLCETPCGLWQISPIHLVRGYAMLMEITMFPLAPVGDGGPFLLSLVRPIDGIMPASLAAETGLAVDTACQFEFLDTGAGVPQWLELAA